MRQAAVEAQQEAECKATHEAAAQSRGDYGVPLIRGQTRLISC